MNTKKNLKILIVADEGGQFFYYKGAVEELLKRGHNVSMLFAKGADTEFILGSLKQFQAVNPGFEFGAAYTPSSSMNMVLIKRRFSTYRRLLLAQGRPKFYSNRVIIYLPFFLRFAARHNLFYINAFIKSGIFGKWLGYVEEKIPRDKNIIAQLRALSPAVLVASTGDLSSTSPESEYLKAAKAVGIPTALSVVSWDHLETKVTIQIIPDILLVWNKIQAEEAEKCHWMPRSVIRIVGTMFFDVWFETRKSPPREEFCARYNIDPKKPILTYFSSSGVYGDEIEHLRKIYKAIEGLGIQLVIRPYPSYTKRKVYRRRLKFYRSPESSGVTLIPPSSLRPFTEDSAQIFYDTIYHSFAYIGIGNSGMIDGMLIGRPGITLIDDHYNDIQSESPHVKHLIASGALRVAKSIDSLRNIIKNLQTGKDGLEAKRQAFIKEYLRPMGIKVPVAQLIADEIEKLLK